MSFLFEGDFDPDDKVARDAVIERIETTAALPTTLLAKADNEPPDRPWRKSHAERWDAPDAFQSVQTLEVGGKVVRYEERFGSGHCASVEGTTRPLQKTGARIWDAALILSKFLENQNHFPPQTWRYKKVIELGAGLGVPSLSAATLGAELVVATDMPENIELLNRNIQLNFSELNSTDGASHRMQAQSLLWGDLHAAAALFTQTRWDLILCSDLLVLASSIDALVATIVALSHDNTITYSCMEHRFDDAVLLYERMRSAGFEVTRIEQAEMDQVFRGAAFHLYKMQRTAKK